MASPSDYAARLTRLQTLGVGEGVPHYVIPNWLKVPGFDMLLHGYVGDDENLPAWDFAIDQDAITRILESCLWETLRGWAGRSQFATAWWAQGIDIWELGKMPVLVERATLLEAADAVIAHLEKGASDE